MTQIKLKIRIIRARTDVALTTSMLILAADGCNDQYFRNKNYNIKITTKEL